MPACTQQGGEKNLPKKKYCQAMWSYPDFLKAVGHFVEEHSHKNMPRMSGQQK